MQLGKQCYRSFGVSSILSSHVAMATLFSCRSGLSGDACLRNALAGVYSTLYGRLTSPCISQVFSVYLLITNICTCIVIKVGIVIDLKEKADRTSLASPVGIPQ